MAFLNGYYETEGPLGFPMRDQDARALESLLKALPEEDRRPRRHVVEKATTELLAGERSDVSWISTEAIDRDREVMRSKGLNLSCFKGNPIVTLAHNYELPPVGRSVWQKAVKDGDRLGIKAKTVYPARPADWQGEQPWMPDKAFALVQAGLMQGKSIGFLPLKYHVPSSQEVAQAPVLKDVTRVIDEWLLLEYACTWLPVNPEALVEGISKAQLDLPEELRKALGIAELQHPMPAPPAAPPGAPPVVKFTALEEIERALTARVESLPLDQLVQDYFDRKRGRV
jgi:hypothetical protein